MAMAKRKTKQGAEWRTVESMIMQLKAPDEWFRALDAWREKQDFTPKPSRPASIRWIVWTFLQKQQQAARTKRRRPK